MDEIQDLIAQHPELDAEELASLYMGMENDDEDDRPRPYDKDERAAHDLVLAYLQHIGTTDWDGVEGEQSSRSRAELIQKAGIVTVDEDEDSQPIVVLPIGIFHQLMADMNLLANLQALANGEGNAQDFWLRIVQSRLAEHAARRAWLANHGQDEA